jgi:hypothetical protein
LIEWKNGRPRAERPSCENSAYVGYAPLGFSLDASLWLHWQLKNRSLLTLTQRCQQHDLAVGKLQRIMMSRDLFSVDLPKDRRLVPNHVISPTKDTNRLARDLASKRQFGSWSNADHHVRIF